MEKSNNICYLCGEEILEDPVHSDLQDTKDHVPPKQFFPKQLRDGLNLETAPSHKRCNNEYSEDETYFYNSLYLKVDRNNPAMGLEMWTDIKRRSQKPQNRKVIRNITANTSHMSPGGIMLPPSVMGIDLEMNRINRVALKIARGVLFLKNGEVVADKCILELELCDNQDEVPEIYRMSGANEPLKGSSPDVFAYNVVPIDDVFYISMLFWGAFMFCLTIQGAMPDSLVEE